MKYHLAHIIPSPRLHGLNGYKEMIDSIQWGLGQLGHEVSYAVNEISGDATNILFGAQMIPLATLQAMPANTIVYQLEQLKGFIKPDYLYALSRFTVWDYDEGNIGFIHASNPEKAVRLVPVGYAPVLERVGRSETQDIDVLIYGIAGQERLAAVYDLSRAGLVTVFVSGLYGAARDALIARSKLVLNISLYKKVFETGRVFYLLANQKAVVSVVDPNMSGQAEYKEGVHFSDPSKLVADCEALVRDDTRRGALERSGYSLIKNRDIRGILSEALAA